MTLNTPLSIESFTSTCPSQSIVVNKVQLLICQFHYEHGPELAFPKDFDQSEYITSLFPAKWADGKCLICKVGKYYVISIGILCQNIQTPRGNLQLSVGIVSTKPIFTRQQHEFLIDIQNRISVAKSVD